MEKDLIITMRIALNSYLVNIMRLLLLQTENISIVLKIFILIEKMNSNI